MANSARAKRHDQTQHTIMQYHHNRVIQKWHVVMVLYVIRQEARREEEAKVSAHQASPEIKLCRQGNSTQPNSNINTVSDTLVECSML